MIRVQISPLIVASGVVFLTLCSWFIFINYENGVLSFKERHAVPSSNAPVEESHNGSVVTSGEVTIDVADKDIVDSLKKYVLSPELREKGLIVLDAFAELVRQENISWFLCCVSIFSTSTKLKTTDLGPK